MKRPLQEKPSLDLIEEAFHLLRGTGAVTLVSYFVGSLPFGLGLLYFWSDMARGIDARERLLTGAWALTMLFVWMKAWQSVYARQLLARLRGEASAGLNFRDFLRLALAQAILQPVGLFVLPVALVLTLPFGWACAFFQNATVLGGADGAVNAVRQKAWRLAKVWPIQNHSLVLLFALFALLVFLNVASAAFLVPFLLKLVTGVESAITRSPQAALNSTFVAAAGVLAWLCVDPFVKAAYVLRCFYGDSLRTGEDLRTELQQFGQPVRAAVPAVLALAFLLVAANLRAAESPEEPVGRAPIAVKRADSLAPPTLDRAIEQVLQEREYTWRLPRERTPTPKEEKGWLTNFIESIFEGIGNGLKKGVQWLDDLIRWIFSKVPQGQKSGSVEFDWLSAMKALLVVLVAAIVGLLGYFLYRLWQRRRRAAAEVTAEALPPVPDLADENTGAGQLPEDGWLKLAREMIEAGDLRLAVRAFYLASLAHLAGRNLITLARFKSNLDYHRELQRRGHALPLLAGLFGGNVAVFDRIWYGLHEVSPEMVRDFAANVERIRTGA